MKKTGSFLLAFMCSHLGIAQEVEMADTLRSEGKIYVVVSILLIVLAGLIGYLVLIDRKVGRLEKNLGDNKGHQESV